MIGRAEILSMIYVLVTVGLGNKSSANVLALMTVVESTLSTVT